MNAPRFVLDISAVVVNFKSRQTRRGTRSIWMIMSGYLEKFTIT
jgi:hypothetical protein